MRVVRSPGNAAVKAARKLARARVRAETGTFLVEGPHAVAGAGEHLERLFVTAEAHGKHADVVAGAVAGGTDVVQVDEQVLASLTTTPSPQGIVGVARLPRADLAEAVAGARLVVVLVDAREPGNVGTVIRTADAAGADAVVLAGACAEPGSPRAVRASAGSLFHLPVAAATWAAALAACRAARLRTVAADGAAALRHTDLDLTGPVALVFGNEAHGLPAEVLAACDEAAHVPIHGAAESLNLAAAAAVFCYEVARQRADVEEVTA
jgi:TrmH family RNA methyltransferase